MQTIFKFKYYMHIHIYLFILNRAREEFQLLDDTT